MAFVLRKPNGEELSPLAVGALNDAKRRRAYRLSAHAKWS